MLKIDPYSVDLDLALETLHSLDQLTAQTAVGKEDMCLGAMNALYKFLVSVC